MAERRECVVAWCDGEPFAIVDEQIEDEDGPDPAEVRMVELRDGERVLTAEEWNALLWLVVAAGTAESPFLEKAYSELSATVVAAASDHAKRATASLLAAAKETR